MSLTNINILTMLYYYSYLNYSYNTLIGYVFRPFSYLGVPAHHLPFSLASSGDMSMAALTRRSIALIASP